MMWALNLIWAVISCFFQFIVFLMALIIAIPVLFILSVIVAVITGAIICCVIYVIVEVLGIGKKKFDSMQL